MRPSTIFKYRHLLRQRIQSGVIGFLSEYETPKLVLIHSFTFAVLLRIMQIIILVYSVLYLLIYEQGYQKQDTAIISSVTLKVKGIGYVNISKHRTTVIDVADYIIPPSENNAIFIMTNFIQTDQTRSTCAENPLLKEAKCEKDRDCKNRPFSPRINGLWTGRCLFPQDTNTSNDTMNSTTTSTGLCEYAGWCPPETDRAPQLHVNEVLNFTLFIKNFIEFPAFNVKHKNMVDELKPCVFHPVNDKDCPIFSIEYIIKQAEKDPIERASMLEYGGVIRVKLDWDCNLDRSIKQCKPEYSFARLDVPFRDKPFSVGFNFRHSSNWKYHNMSYRTLSKVFGLRLIIAVSGKAGRFDFITLTLNTGSLVGIFGLATFLCDIILLHVSKQARLYRGHVFEKVHLRTRDNSIIEHQKDSIDNNHEHQNHNSTTHDTVLDTKIYPGKTVVTRPLTLMNLEQLKTSDSI